MILTTQGDRPKFWMIAREDGSLLHRRYYVEKEAIDKAERLCMQSQEVFSILVADVYCTRINVPVKWELTKGGDTNDKESQGENH